MEGRKMRARIGIGGHAGPVWASVSATARSRGFWRLAGVSIAVAANMLMVYLVITGHFGVGSTIAGVSLGAFMAVRGRHHQHGGRMK
jgi:hypothetical protein